MAIFQVKDTTSEKMSIENKAYIQLTNLPCVPQNNLNNAQRIAIIIFGIEIDISCLTTRLPNDKLEKVTKATVKILS